MTKVFHLVAVLPAFFSLDISLFLIAAATFAQFASADTLDRLASLGVGGLLAGVTYYWKRADDLAHRAELKAIIENQQKQNDRLLEYISASTATHVELKKAVDALAVALHVEDKLSAIQIRLETARDKK
jgi:hypothetical protein